MEYKFRKKFVQLVLLT